jgi:hypothetical protein
MSARWLVVLSVGCASLACLRGPDEPLPIDTLPIDTLPIDTAPAAPTEGWAPEGPGLPEPDRGKRGKRHRLPPPDTRPDRPDRDRQNRGGIERIDQQTWKIERRKIREWSADPDTLGAHAEKGGGGYKLERVEPGSDAAALGVRTGDVLRKVNGKSLKDANPMDLWLELKGQSKFEVQIERGGEPRTHQYKIVD